MLHERVLPSKHAGWKIKLQFAVYELLHRTTKKADEYFGLGDDHQLTIDICPVELT